jgi:DNA-binding transcriptional ArsR family regulator
MIGVRVLNARRLEGEGPLAIGDVELDSLLEVRQVEVRHDGNGKFAALPPARPFGDGRRVLDWTPAVAQQVGQAIAAALDGDRRAILGTRDEPGAIERFVWGSEAPPSERADCPRPEPAGALAPSRQRLVDLVWEEEGLGVEELAERTGLARSSVRQYLSDAVAAGLLRSERSGVRYFPATTADVDPLGRGPNLSSGDSGGYSRPNRLQSQNPGAAPEDMRTDDGRSR